MSDVRTDRRRLLERGPDTFLDGVDCRYRAGKLLKQKYEALINDLGGPEQLSYQETVMARRVIHLEAVLEDAENARLDGQHVLEWNHYFSAINTLTGLLRALGLQRRVKQVESLQSYIEGKGK